MNKDERTMHIEGRTLRKAHDCEKLVVPGYVERIAARAFEGFSGQEIHIPKSIERIESHAFSGCTADIIFEKAPENVKFHPDAFAHFGGGMYVSKKEKGRTLPEVCDKEHLLELGTLLARILPKIFR